MIGPNGQWVTPPLVDEPGIVFADCDLNAILRGRLFHDIVGHYNRFDVFRLEIDRSVRAPLHPTGGAEDVPSAVEFRDGGPGVIVRPLRR
ncbi:hypothetical protein [Gaiella occulta]|uniref:hypothetical protein n=1 Tax=Gaiella occulta TaxID=1002870 RepID=UPI0011C040EE|nr:hypothetical protein [Gaiella occulta]